MKNTILSITNHNDLEVSEVISVHRDAQEGYVFFINDIFFDGKTFDIMIKELSTVYNITMYDYSKSKNNIFKKYSSKEFILYVSGSASELFGSFSCKSEEICQFLWEHYKKHNKQSTETEIYNTSFFLNHNNLEDKTTTIDHSTLSYIDKNYYPYLDTDELLKQFFTGNENILILIGEPGTGKSKFASLAIDFLYNNEDYLPYNKILSNPSLDSQYISIGTVKSNEVLSNDMFWRTLEQAKFDLIIIDDLDHMLTKREDSANTKDNDIKNAFLNQFLTFTDGVQKNNTKFIITTNQSFESVDSALLRKGRLFNILEPRKLDKTEALKIWNNNNLDEKSFAETFNTHEILPALLGSEIAKRKNKKINIKCSYVLEEDISKIDKATRSTRIGI